MFIGFLCSRAALSVSMFLFGVNGIRDVNPREWFRNKWWLIGVGWVALFALSYFSSEDKGTWYVHFQQKYPFLILPLAFPYLPKFSVKQLQAITIVVGSVLMVSACYSMSFLFFDPVANISRYRVGGVLPTLPKLDHIRASIAITLFVVWSVYVWPVFKDRFWKWVLGVMVGIFVIYIHIVAIKSGIVSLYLFLIAWGLYLSFAKKKLIGIIVIIAIPVFTMFGLKYMPTFREKAQYIDFTYFMFTHGDQSGNFGDINRLMSYKIALIIIAQHPLLGVGGGDMLSEMDKGFHNLYPDVRPESVILPHNQFLDIGLSSGIPAMILFTVWIFMPLARMRRNRQSFFFFVVWLILFLQLMIEPVLEVQFGVFVYLYFLLMAKHELPCKTENEKFS